MSYKTTFKLKQHTPLIHFHNQEGATLRATELKPKLDKYLINIFKKDGDDIDYSRWLVRGKEKALDYKVKIVGMNISNKKIFKKKKIPSYFGNMGDDYVGNEKYSSYTDKEILLTICTFHQDLLEVIEREIAHFFAFTNFGTRQSKGFGSFFLEGKNIKDFEKEFHLYFTIDGNFNKNDFVLINRTSLALSDVHMRILGSIELFYKSLRSGINRYNKYGPVFYIKPAIFYFAMNKMKEQWDKKTIKSNYFVDETKEYIDFHNESKHDTDILSFTKQKEDEDYYLIKDLFGLSSEEQWQNPYESKITKEHINGDIERFKSPLFFKVIKSANNKFLILVKGNPIDTDFFNQVFVVKQNDTGSLELTTPKEEDFNWDDFFIYVKEELPSVDKRSTFTNKAHAKEYFVLNYIYSQFQKGN